MSQSPAQFAIRTLRALEVLAFTPATASGIAEALLIHPRRARRLLSQLQRDGWLSYRHGASERIYAPTLRFVALAAEIGARAPLTPMTSPALEWLHAATGRPATLTIHGYSGTVCVARCLGEHGAEPGVAAVAPAHCTAAGKVLLAYREAWRRSVLATPLERCTEQTVTDPTVLDDELNRVRYHGYALENEEHLDGVCGVAAPVVGPGGPVLAAISVVTSDSQVCDRNIDEVRAAARQASDTVGAAVDRYALEPRIVYRLLASYGLRPVDAYL
jgi:IclR family acetate operon transcriptional repressor